MDIMEVTWLRTFLCASFELILTSNPTYTIFLARTDCFTYVNNMFCACRRLQLLCNTSIFLSFVYFSIIAFGCELVDVGEIVKSRTVEVANFLEMLRSASGTSTHLKLQKDWKVVLL